MVICHCLAVNDQAIAELAADPAIGVPDVVARCGAGGACGNCHDAIAWVLDRARTRVAEQSVAIASPA